MTKNELLTVNEVEKLRDILAEKIRYGGKVWQMGEYVDLYEKLELIETEED